MIDSSDFDFSGRRILVTICADFWFSDLFARAGRLPDLVLVPAYSVTRKSTPDYSRSLWRHLAIARAYELGVYVGISDWGYAADAPKPSQYKRVVKAIETAPPGDDAEELAP